MALVHRQRLFKLRLLLKPPTNSSRLFANNVDCKPTRVRKPPTTKDLRLFAGNISVMMSWFIATDVECLVPKWLGKEQGGRQLSVLSLPLRSAVRIHVLVEPAATVQQTSISGA